MVTKRGKGSGLLPYPKLIDEILQSFFETQEMQLSVKLRAGLHSEKELEQIIPVLNSYPLKEVILHPRIAKQLYSGKIDESAFVHASNALNHKLVYNGDIFSLSDFEHRKKQFVKVEEWMIGRGILMNPFLPAEIKQVFVDHNKKREMLLEFHELMLENYLELMDNEGNALNKMQQFWVYFSHNFPNPKKTLKAIKKSKGIVNYKNEVRSLFAQL